MNNPEFTKEELDLIKVLVREALDNSDGSCPFDGTEIEDIIREGSTRNTACDIMYKLTGDPYYAPLSSARAIEGDGLSPLERSKDHGNNR